MKKVYENYMGYQPALNFQLSKQLGYWLMLAEIKNIFEDSSQEAKCYNTHVAGKQCCLVG